MDIALPIPGKYVVAVSGGVDSVALLHRLQRVSGFKLIVAHFDHGIRPDSRADKQFVAELAQSYDLPFIADEGKLGNQASEAQARAARYVFLERAVVEHQADAIVTAHHQDDVLETAIINLARGTGRKGLTALDSNVRVLRPLRNVPKSTILAYAGDNSLQWREDATNNDDKYLRNYIRHTVMPRMDNDSQQKLLNIISTLRSVNNELDSLLEEQLQQHLQNESLDRQWFTSLTHEISKELMATWLRLQDIRDFDRKTLDRLVIAAKVAQPGSKYDVIKGRFLEINSDNLALSGRER